jgi:hypothetical protein
MARVASAGNACDMIPRDRITLMLGTTKNTSLNTIKLPPKATDGKACAYSGVDYVGTVIVMKFESPAAAREYLQSVRKDLERQALKTTAEKFEGEDGFSFDNGMLVVKRDTMLRVNVNPPVTKGKVIVNLGLTRQLLLLALQGV